jgi:hypothetical protein
MCSMCCLSAAAAVSSGGVSHIDAVAEIIVEPDCGNFLAAIGARERFGSRAPDHHEQQQCGADVGRSHPGTLGVDKL